MVLLDEAEIEIRLESMRSVLAEIDSTELAYIGDCLDEVAKKVHSLPPRTKSPRNLFELFGQRYRERAHSNILAYLLNPREAHGLSTVFLEKFLDGIGLKFESDSLVEAVVKREVAAGRAIADIVIEMPDHIIVIENKVGAREHAEQTIRMEKGFRGSSHYSEKDIAFVYLTKDADSPASDAFVPVLYDTVLSCLEQIPLSPLSDLPIVTQVLMASFAEHVKEDFYSMSGFKEELSPRAQLYLQYRDEIKQVREAFEEDSEAVRQWYEVVEDLLSSGDWEFNPKPTWQQLFKENWREKNKHFVHFEIFLSEGDISKGRFRFMLEVEFSRKEEVLREIDAVKESIVGELSEIGSQYRPARRDKAIAYKEYSLEADLSNLREQLRKAFEEHIFLVPVVDEILDKLD